MTEPQAPSVTDNSVTNGVTNRWMHAYLAAWASNEPEDIRALFTEDASYRTEPYANAWLGHEQIVDGWLHHADTPDSFTFEWAPLAVTQELSVVEGTTRYATGTVYSNLWVIRFGPDGRAHDFTEWWMDQARTSAPE